MPHIIDQKQKFGVFGNARGSTDNHGSAQFDMHNIMNSDVRNMGTDVATSYG